MTVDTDPFPSTTVSMVDACLPKSKGKEKVGFTPVQHILKKHSQPRLKIDLFSNAPPTKLSGPAIVESMLDSSEEENDGPIVLCSNCKAHVILTKPKEKLPQTQMSTSQQQSTTTAAPSKEPSEGQSQKVFDRLDPKKQIDGSTSVRCHLNLTCHFIMRIIIHVIPVAQAH
ncbi:hypothetical protein ACFX2B_037533 [Malus domestica]